MTKPRRAPARINLKAIARIAATAGLMLAAPAFASDANGKFVIRGLGSASCQNYLDALIQADKSGPYIAWVLGYTTAANRLSQQTFDVVPTTDGLDLPRLIGVVCRAEPSQSLASATERTLASLAPLRQVAETPLVSLSHQGRTMTVREGALQMLTVGLTAKRLYRGPTTGQPNADLYRAIKTLQEREKLPVTGLPDIDTFIRAVIKN